MRSSGARPAAASHSGAWPRWSPPTPSRRRYTGCRPTWSVPVRRRRSRSRSRTSRSLKGAWGSPPGKVLDKIDREPLAVTPSAQVHRGVRDGTAVAVKVLRPGLAGAVRNDLALLDVLAAPLRQVFGAMDAGAILREVRETALDELDLEHEASTQRQLRRTLRGVDGLVVPAPDMELAARPCWSASCSRAARWPIPRQGRRPRRGRPDARGRARHRGACRLVLTDPRPGHVVLMDKGQVGLLGAGLARPVDATAPPPRWRRSSPGARATRTSSPRSSPTGSACCRSPTRSRPTGWPPSSWRGPQRPGDPRRPCARSDRRTRARPPHRRAPARRHRQATPA